ncbi:iron-containing alcohol dehydrogenase family protein [Flammeovirgaceae bacterium SG7u.111]|nr:iron-containing alcohol dehydrogenase family protein [Flammeovirgaceae bacterium SG7u.132]WPO33690.1 iron-containing alcohol dehydrogenase family protein [Flammeovirgaceae bacterium SG7u.111]
MHKILKNVDKVVYGRGSFNQLDDILAPIRAENDNFMVFVVDKYFEGKPLADRVPAKPEDVVLFVDVDEHEPTTVQVDTIRDTVKSEKGVPSGLIGIGGGSIMDIAKAASLMFTNDGSSSLYQGLNLVKNPGIYHAGVPTLSGTGAECSTTAVVTGPEKKLGLKCEWTPFNQIVLDPELIYNAPRNQWFYTGMDTYIHCIESETGTFKNAFSSAYAQASLELCRDVFLRPGGGQSPEGDDKLMVASLMGGLSLTYSEVGACHALSYGLSFVFGYRHGIANCIAFDKLEDFYGDGVKEFREMVAHNQVEIPQNLAKTWTDEQITQMAEVSYKLGHMWTHAIGPDWEEKLTLKDIEALFRRL